MGSNWLSKAIVGPVKRHSAELLLALGLTSGAAALGLSVIATTKAIPLIEKRKEELNVKKLPVGEIVKTTWKCYIPTASTALISVGCIIGANHANFRKITALNAAYNVSEVALSEYQKKVTELVGPEKELEVRDAIAKDQIAANPVSQNTIIVTDGGGDTLCYDSQSGRYFRSSRDKLNRSSTVLSRTLLDEMYVSLNDFYSEIGLPEIDAGRDIGWNVDNGLVELWFSSQIDEYGTPCLVMNYVIEPRSDYRTH